MQYLLSSVFLILFDLHSADSVPGANVFNAKRFNPGSWWSSVAELGVIQKF